MSEAVLPVIEQPTFTPPSMEDALELLYALEQIEPSIGSRDTAGHYLATTMPITEVTRLLCGLISVIETAKLAGVGEARAAEGWAEGTRAPRHNAQSRLRLAVHICTLLYDDTRQGICKTWFKSLNPWLNDVRPVRCLSTWDADSEDKPGQAVLEAARDMRAYLDSIT